MALPSKRSSATRKRNRQGSLRLKKVSLVKCPKCKQTKIPGRVCNFCGSYKGREVIKIKTKKKKTGKK